ncbi:ABC transporter ATP-binding protein [Ruegeria arenilitoris]|uniref:ABC transporter ATP-binding protein n=1 Tax=Ruegeria arenilitoris TaxID=1173585 RepID=UPI00147CF91F|nr:ABC transporter ATP-binding protein [Ruegeria arenilitoris]
MFNKTWAKWKSSHIGRLLGESLRNQGWLYGIAMAAMVVVAGTTAGTAWMMENIVNAMTEPEMRSKVGWVALAVIGLFFSKAAASYVQAVFLARAGNRIIAVQQERLYAKLIKRGVGFFSRNESSGLLMRVTNGAQAARVLVDVVVTSFVRDLLTLVGLVFVMIYQQPMLSVLFFVVGPVALVSVRMLLKRVKAIMQSELMALSEIIKVLQETSGGITIIKVFALEKHMTGRMNGAIRAVEERANSISKLQSVASPLMEFLAGLAIAGILVISAIGFGDSEPTSAGQLMSFITALLMAYEPAKRLSRMRVVIETTLVPIGMMFELLDEEEPMRERPDAKAMEPGPGEIRLKDLTFGYKGDTPVISNMNLTFEAGKTTALVGQSGGGKSTIFGLILRFYDPDSGAVEIDGQDLQGVTFASLRQKISYVGQETFLFSASVMDNLRYARPDATDEEVMEAARAAHAHDFISKLEYGYDTPVGERGAFLSGGQKQRLAIARAILRKSEILLLDEATSALDAESETLVKKALDKLTENVTTIVIAHRLSTVLEADKIFVIQDGEVLEEGNLESLIEKDGVFRQLFDHQFKQPAAEEATSSQ